jgi:hypothetical protein
MLALATAASGKCRFSAKRLSLFTTTFLFLRGLVRHILVLATLEVMKGTTVKGGAKPDHWGGVKQGQ